MNLKKLDDLEGKIQYQVKISYRFATLQNLVGVSTGLENV